MNSKNIKEETRHGAIALAIAILCFSMSLVTAIPQQDYTIYGTATLDGTVLTAQDDAVISLAVGGVELVSYTMGDIPGTNNYVLRVPLDSDPGVTTAAQEGDTAYIHINGVAINEGPQIVGAPATTVQLDISATSANNPPSYPFANDSYLISPHTGWNMISLPLMPKDTDVLDLLSSVEDNWNSVWAYECGKWEHYDRAGPNFLNDLSTLEPGKGYWINMGFNDTLSVSGSELTNKSIPLSSGWNFVGYNSLCSRSITDAMNSVAGNWNSVWTYEDGRWKHYDLSGPVFLNDLTTMRPGKGYWIKMKLDDTWSLDV